MVSHAPDPDKAAERLLRSAATHSFDPTVDVDWDVDEWAAPGMPFEHVSIFGTPLWDGLTHEQRVTLSRHEMASVAAVGLWFEIILVQMLSRHVYDEDPKSPATHFALTEIADECRHIMMFARAARTQGMPRYRVPRRIHRLARLYKALAAGPCLFAPVLVAEETLDRLQRATMQDEAISPLIRAVNRIHVVEEARHVRFAREVVARDMPELGPIGRRVHQLLTAVVSYFVVTNLIDPEVYRAVGLDPAQARRVARDNPRRHESMRWMGEKVMAFLDEQGLVTRLTRPIYERAHLV